MDGRVVRDYIKPVAVRCCGGQSLEDQPFLRMARFNWKLTPELRQAVPGLFHVTTTEAWSQILQEGLKPGIDLPKVGRQGGRADIHLLVVPPYPNDKLNNERLSKMWHKWFQEVIVNQEGRFEHERGQD